MSAWWMIGATVVAILFALGAEAGERVMSLYRGAPLRWVWGGATVASLAVAALWMAPHHTPAARAEATAVHANIGSIVPAAPARFQLPWVPPATERALLVGWAIGTAVFATILIVAAFRLRSERRRWTTTTLSGTDVLLSPEFGPAIVGLLRPEITVPRWVLGLDESSRRAIVVHEEEHRKSRDPWLLLPGLVAVVLMPWNVGLWMSWRGLRRAIELDCDQRVLARGVERAEYAGVLMSAWGLAHDTWMPTVAFVERGSGLGTRIEQLMRLEPRRRGMRTFMGVAVAAALIVVACAVPGPQEVVAPKSTYLADVLRPVNTKPSPLIILDGVRQTATIAQLDSAYGRRFTDEIASVEVLKGARAIADYGQEAVNGVIVITTKLEVLRAKAAKGG